MSSSIERDIRTIQSIEAVPHIMKMLSDVTGLRFICVARVTEDNWTMCAVYDQVNFNLIPGDQLDIKTTFCSQVRKSTKAIVIEHAKKDDVYRQSEIPKMYGFEIGLFISHLQPKRRFFWNIMRLRSTSCSFKNR
jgi:hypothetical protein